MELDLTSFASIRLFAQEVCSNHRTIELLVNNAGIMFPPYKETAEGFESQWGVNFLGPALLTHLLLPLLRNSSGVKKPLLPRVVNVTSCAHHVAERINFEKINSKYDYIPGRSYAQSKLAQIQFSIQLDRFLNEKGHRVSVHSVHPGIVNTDLFDGTFLRKYAPWVLTYFSKLYKHPTVLFERSTGSLYSEVIDGAETPEKGATAVLFACISPLLDGHNGSSYSGNCRLIRPSSLALSDTEQVRLFQYTKETLDISEFGA